MFGELTYPQCKLVIYSRKEEEIYQLIECKTPKSKPTCNDDIPEIEAVAALKPL